MIFHRNEGLMDDHTTVAGTSPVAGVRVTFAVTYVVMIVTPLLLASKFESIKINLLV